MLKILHITGHLGGGVGTVVLNYLTHKSKNISQRHSVISLDYLNTYAADLLSDLDIEYSDQCHANIDYLNSKIKEADIVLLHWWNHPLITDLLVRNRLAACRLVLWSHISGSPAPNNFTTKTFEYPDELIFTTPLSYFESEFVTLPDDQKAKVDTIWSTGGVERLSSYSSVEHDGFNVGYVGNLDFTKIHPNFVDICQAVKIPDIRFTVVGPLNDKLVNMVNAAGLADRIHFTGFVSEDEKWVELCKFDIFGYPLAPHHYGTCDQTLQEAMAVGIVPVVLNNPMESYIVKHGMNGLVARSVAEYVECLHSLYEDKEMHARLSQQARSYAFSDYSLERMASNWDSVFKRLMRKEKKEKSWPGLSRGMVLEPHHVFLESLGRYGGVFAEHLGPNNLTKAAAEDQLKSLGSRYNWSSDNKSTVHQYVKFFPDDAVLCEWSRLMKGVGKGAAHEWYPR
jgi:L-malate glycosyltransferase